MTSPSLINGSKAIEFRKTIADPVVKTILDCANNIVSMKFLDSSGKCLSADFDLRFFAEVIAELCSDKDLIRRMLNGERPGAWDDLE